MIVDITGCWLIGATLDVLLKLVDHGLEAVENGSVTELLGEGPVE